MTVEKLVNALDNLLVEITIIDERRGTEIYHGPARGAVELGYGKYRIRWTDGSRWYW